MAVRTVLAAVIGLALVGACVVGGWYVLHEHPPAFCEISGRPIHGNMHTLVEVDGEKLYACCARCPLTLAAQTGKPVRILEVADYLSGRTLPAPDAYYVDGSRVEVCTAPLLKRDENRAAYVRLFDRCAPSLLAFARAEDARAFVGEHGGTIKRLPELMRERSAPAATEEEDRHD